MALRTLKSSKLSTRLQVSKWQHRRRYADKAFPVPHMGMDSVVEGTVGKWKKQVGQQVNIDDVVVVLETDKIEFEVKSPVAGVLTKGLANPGDVVRVGQDLFQLDVGATSGTTSQAPSAPAPSPAPKSAAPSPQQAAPQPPKPAQASPVKESKPEQAPQKLEVQALGGRTERRVKMPQIRKRIAQRLKSSQNTAAMLTTFNEIDMYNIMELRNKYKDVFLKKHNVKLGFMSAFVKASSIALSNFPEVNAVIEDESESILYRDYHDISVAVASPAGLVVPVIRNAETLSFASIEKTIGALADKAKDRKLSIEDMTGGTFTISNGGTYGSMMGTPIINPPQSAILGMHATNQRAHVVNGEIKIRPIMYIALTYDHRLIDGREAVLFLKKIKSCIEEPESILLDL